VKFIVLSLSFVTTIAFAAAPDGRHLRPIADAPAPSQLPRSAASDPSSTERARAASAQEAAKPRSAQPPPPPAAPPAPQTPRAGRETPPPPPPAPPPASERRVLPTRNVKVDVTITDQTGTGAAMKKVVSLVVADGRSSSVRSMTQMATQRRETETSIPINDYRNLPLNIDTYVSITAEQRVLLELKFNYGSVHRVARTPAATAEAAGGQADLTFGEITENLWTLLNVGEPVVVSRSADASSDRTVTVEVKAEIVK
jgi:hypothetical protein